MSLYDVILFLTLNLCLSKYTYGVIPNIDFPYLYQPIKSAISHSNISEEMNRHATNIIGLFEIPISTNKISNFTLKYDCRNDSACNKYNRPI